MTADDGALVALVLLAALMHASWNALLKASGRHRAGETPAQAALGRVVTQVCVVATGMVIGGLLLPFLPPLPSAAWPYLLASVAIHTLYYVFLVAAYRFGDLSQVYPICRGLPPLVIALASPWLLGETLHWGELVGIGVLSLGIGSLALSSAPAAANPAAPSPSRHRLPVLLAVCTGLLTASYTVVDALGVRAGGVSSSYTAWLFFLDGFPYIAMTLWQQRKALNGRLPALRVAPGMLAGTLSMASYALILGAMKLGAVAPIAALRETSVIFAAILGRLWLQEGFGSRRIAAACSVALGVLLIQMT